MDKSDFAKRLANKLIEQLKAGTAPWQQPWEAGQMANAYTDPRWMTYKQAQPQGWQVRGGEKGTQIQHWIWEEARPRLGKDRKPELDDAGKPIKDMVRLSRPKVLVAAVFNAEQIDGIPDLEPARDVGWDPLEKAERLLGASGAKIQHSQGGKSVLSSFDRYDSFAVSRTI